MKTPLLVAALCCAVVHGFAQSTPTLTYTTEGLWNVRSGHADWINILVAQYSAELWSGAAASVTLLASDNLRQDEGKDCLTPVAHIFSAIEDDSAPLSLFLMGITQKIGFVNLFFGVRNVNEDYFTTPWNSVFTSSVGGLFPCLSVNYPISDSPLSALCLHAEAAVTERIHLKMSLYNGRASNLWSEVFAFRPHRDGLLGICEVGYTGGEKGYDGNYRLGFVGAKTPSETDGRKRFRKSFWALAEQPLYVSDSGGGLELLLHAGWSPDCLCHGYWAAGVLWKGVFAEDDYIGLLYDRSLCSEGDETAAELTYARTVGCCTVQPALHRVYYPGGTATVAMMKLQFEF